MEHKLDTLNSYRTPEGVELSFALAGPFPRGMAWLIDLGIRIVCYITIGIISSLLGGMGSGLFLITIFLLEWFYPVFFEVRSGMTPGKRIIGLQVIRDDGTPVSWTSSILRNLIRNVDFLPFFNMTGLVTMFLNPKFKRLGDLAAGTLVIYQKESSTIFKVPDGKPKPAPTALKVAEQRLILDFCERSSTLSEERRKELASELSELTGKDDPEASLISYGNWFLKGRD